MSLIRQGFAHRLQARLCWQTPNIPRNIATLTTVTPDFSQMIHPSFTKAIASTCPLPFQLGIDTCDVFRVRRLITKPSSIDAYARFSSRVLTPLELQLQLVPQIRRAEFLAGRWAAKEAIIKAMRSMEGEKMSEKTYMHDIVVLPRPIVEALVDADVYSGDFKMKETITLAMVQKVKGPLRAFVRSCSSAELEQWQEVLVSVSHDGDNAIAVAFVTSAPGATS